MGIFDSAAAGEQAIFCYTHAVNVGHRSSFLNVKVTML